MLSLWPEYPDKCRQLLTPLWGFFVGSVVKNLPAYVGDMGSIPGWGRSPGEGNGNPLQYSCLENPMGRGVWWAAVPGVARDRIWLCNWTTPPSWDVDSGLVSSRSTEEYWSGLAVSFSRGSSWPRDQTQSNLLTLMSPASASGFSTTEPPGKPKTHYN